MYIDRTGKRMEEELQLQSESFVSNQMSQIHNPDCESICVKIELEGIPLVIYLAYVNEQDINILMKHVSLI